MPESSFRWSTARTPSTILNANSASVGNFVLYLSCISLNASNIESTVMHSSCFRKPSLSNNTLGVARIDFFFCCFCSVATVSVTAADAERSARLPGSGTWMVCSAFVDFLSSIKNSQYCRLPVMCM